MPEPFTMTAALIGLVGSTLGASEKGLSIYQKLWPAKTEAKEGILVGIAKELPGPQREEAVTAMKGIYEALAAAEGHVKLIQRRDWVRSVRTLVASSAGVILVSVAAQLILATLTNTSMAMLLVALAVSAILSLAAGWFSIDVYVPGILDYLQEIRESISSTSPDRVNKILRSAEALREEALRASRDSDNSFLGGKFLRAFEGLRAKVEALELCSLNLQFIQADEQLRRLLWSRLEDAVVDAIAEMVETKELRPRSPETEGSEGRNDQYDKIQRCLKSLGVAEMFNSADHEQIWKEDVVFLLALPDGKNQLKERMRHASRVPTFGML